MLIKETSGSHEELSSTAVWQTQANQLNRSTACYPGWRGRWAQSDVRQRTLIRPKMWLMEDKSEDSLCVSSRRRYCITSTKSKTQFGLFLKPNIRFIKSPNWFFSTKQPGNFTWMEKVHHSQKWNGFKPVGSTCTPPAHVMAASFIWVNAHVVCPSERHPPLSVCVKEVSFSVHSLLSLYTQLCRVVWHCCYIRMKGRYCKMEHLGEFYPY